MKKKTAVILAAVVAALLVGLLIGRSGKPQSPDVSADASGSAPAQSADVSGSADASAPAQSADVSSAPDVSAPEKSTEAPAPAAPGRLQKVTASFEYDPTIGDCVVRVTNGSDSIFSGDVSVKLRDEAGRMVGGDTLFVENLPAGQFTWARIPVDGVPVKVERKISGQHFEAPSDTTGDKLDEAATAEISAAFTGSFGGAGNPDWATSWYKYVTSVEVYAGSQKYIKATIDPAADGQAVDRIGNALFGNYVASSKASYSLSRVILVAPDGSTIWEKAA